jgi:hypothetical protein
MTDQRDPPQSDSEDQAIADALRRSSAPPSAEHDAAILAAARAMTEREAPAPTARASATAPTNPSANTAPTAARRWRRPMALAASVLAVLAAFAVLQSPAPEDDALRASIKVSPANGTAIERLPDALIWPEGPGGTRYRVLLLDAQGSVLWRSDWQVSPSWTVPQPPPPVLAQAAATAATGEPVTVRWAVQQAGASTAELGPFAFSLRQR